MDAAEHVLEIGLVNHQRDVPAGGGLREHANRHARYGVEEVRDECRIVLQPVADGIKQALKLLAKP